MKTCLLTLQESDAIMAVLTELPIKYLPIVQQIQAMLQAKFIQADALAEIAQKTKVE